MSVLASFDTSSSVELGNRLQTPTLIGCKFLMINKEFNFFIRPTVISGALYYDTVLNKPIKFSKHTQRICLEKRPT